MPRVSAPQVQRAAVPGVQARSQTNATAMGGGLAQGLDSAGQAALQIAEQARDRARTARLMEFDNLLADQELQTQQAMSQTRGKDALGMSQGQLETWDNQVGQRLQQVGDPELRQKMEMLSSARRRSLESRLAKHELAEGERYAGQQLESLVTKQSELAALNPYDWQRVEGATISIEAAIRDYNGQRGIPEDMTENQVSQAVSGVRRQVVEARIRAGDAPLAKAFYDQYQEDFTSADREALEPKLEAADLRGRGQEISDQLLSEHQDLEAARKAMKGMGLEPKLRDEVDDRITREFGLAERAREEQSRNQFEQWSDQLRQARGDMSVLPNDWEDQVSHSQASALDTLASNYAKGYTPPRYSEQFLKAKILALSDDPRKRQQFMDLHIQLLAPQMNPGDVNELLELQDSLKKGDTAKAQSLLSPLAATKQVMESNDIDPDSDQGRLFIKRMEQVMARETADGSKLSNPQIREIAEWLLVEDTISIPRSWYNPIGWVFGADEEDVRRFEREDFNRLLGAQTIADIPPDELAEIRSDAEAEGMTLTEAEIVAIYNAQGSNG